jgi:NAD+ synthase
MRNWEIELDNRIAFLRAALETSGCTGFVYGNSGGKDSALVGILCKKAAADTLGLIMPCSTARNYGEDTDHALLMAQTFGIAYRTVDLTHAFSAMMDVAAFSEKAAVNIPPRLRMTTLYATAQTENRLVAGTGNRSEIHLGYYTKYGDGGCDINPIADLTVTEIFEFLRFLGAPTEIVDKPPSAGLFEGQTDEAELGLTYDEVDRLLLHDDGTEKTRTKVAKMHAITAHKRAMPLCYGVDA